MRSCTDVICCIFFVLCILGAAACSVFGYARGDPKMLLYPLDSTGRICGQGKLEHKPNLFFFDLLQCARMGSKIVLGCPTTKCPTKNYAFKESLDLERAGDRKSARQKLICKDGVDPVASTESIKKLVKSKKCAAYYVKSKPLFNRCIPTFVEKFLNLKNKMKTKDNYTLVNIDGDEITGSNLRNGTQYLNHFYKLQSYASYVIRDLANSWPHILIGLLIAMCLSMLWVVLLRWLVKVMLWLTLILFAGLFISSSVYSYLRYYKLKSKNMRKKNGPSKASTFSFNYYLKLKQTWLAFGCTSTIILLLFLLIVIILAKRLRIAIELIKEVNKAISKMMLVLFWPLIPFILQMGVVVYWMTSAVYIGSMGSVTYHTENYTDIKEGVLKGDVNASLFRTPCESGNSTLGNVCQFVKFDISQYNGVMQVFMMYMFLWVMKFVLVLGQMTLAGAFASYFWAFNKERDMPSRPVLSSLGRCLRYHLGSLAFGSLVMVLVQMIPLFLEFVDKKLKSSENNVAKFILKCLKCCFWCLEKVFNFINKNAYIMIAVYGRSCCVAVKDPFLLTMRTEHSTFVMDKVSDFIMFISQLMVTGVIGVVFYYWFERSIPFWRTLCRLCICIWCL